jgi:hypothetical protein
VHPPFPWSGGKGTRDCDPAIERTERAVQLGQTVVADHDLPHLAAVGTAGRLMAELSTRASDGSGTPTFICADPAERTIAARPPPELCRDAWMDRQPLMPRHVSPMFPSPNDKFEVAPSSVRA